MKPDNGKLGVFVLAMMNVAIIASLRALPMMAKEGFSLIFFFVAAAVIFLIPIALVSAELATGWSKRGGVYLWVKEAFGQRWGFLAIWLQWIQNVIWYPTVLSFAAATLAYLFNPALAGNKLYTLLVILGVYWGATFASFRGLKTAGWLSTFGVIGGTLVPGAVIIILGFLWMSGGKTPQISMTLKDIVPDMSSLRNIVFLAGVLLTYAGMEVSAVHAQEVENPQKNFPRAILLATLIILVIFILGSLSIAIVVPQANISLTAGLMEAFTDFFNAYHIREVIPLVALLITIGALGQVTAWIVGPSKGLFATAKEGNLPPFFQRVNSRGVPVNLLIIQGLIVTTLSMVFLLMPDVSSSYWILTALTAQLYLLMYNLLYAAAIKLRYSDPDVPRAYRVPGGNMGMWLVAGLGILGALFAIFIGFFPPAQLKAGNILFYELFLIIGISVMCTAPMIIYQMKKPHWLSKDE
jgi:putative glutamate/gamma-aminobutyrate antiporter